MYSVKVEVRHRSGGSLAEVMAEEQASKATVPRTGEHRSSQCASVEAAHVLLFTRFLLRQRTLSRGAAVCRSRSTAGAERLSPGRGPLAGGRMVHVVIERGRGIFSGSS